MSTSNNDYGQYHEEFKSRLVPSDRYKLAVLDFILKRFPCEIRSPETLVAETFADRTQCSDKGDIWMCWRGKWLLIEVKSRTFNFTGPDDINPWKRDERPDHAIVCRVKTFEERKPYAVFIVSKDAKVSGIIRASTRPSWEVSMRTDRQRPNVGPQPFYICPIRLMQFVQLGGH